MTTKRPYAIMQYLDKLNVYINAQKGRARTEGYFMGRERYGSPETAWRQADYINSFKPVKPAYVVDIRSGERVEHPRKDKQ